MNRSNFALFIALLIHLLLLMIFWLLGTIAPEVTKTKKIEEKRMKVSLKEMPKKSKDAGLTKKVIKKPKIAPPMPKGKQLKKIVKPISKPPIKYLPKKIQEQPKVRKQPINKPKPKHDQKIVKKTEPLPQKKPYIKMEPKEVIAPVKVEKKRDPLAWMYEDRSKHEVKKKKTIIRNNSSIDQNIKELYGEEFGELTPGQQQYIIDNQEIMRRITQQVLTRVASVNLSRDINVNRTNVIEFYLHPNGDISDFKFLKKSGYFILDNTTKETIEYAYSRYPRPKEKTLIRYNVFYNLARY